MRILTMSKRVYAIAIVAYLAVAGSACAAQQSTPPTSMRGPAPDSSFVGTYEFSFVPSNGEAITGRLAVRFKGGRYYGVLASPKLSEPLDADSVRVDGSHLFTSSFNGMYTFAFDMHGASITNATFTKSLRGATEEGPLTIKKLRP